MRRGCDAAPGKGGDACWRRGGSSTTSSWTSDGHLVVSTRPRSLCTLGAVVRGVVRRTRGQWFGPVLVPHRPSHPAGVSELVPRPAWKDSSAELKTHSIASSSGTN
ncbi:hypothetical protein KIN20_026688 [Parelaphostrongylus tenuis]|uniref:Uncharacterized protein n=1 Tax=Parelaphostrongylus tenuis TaxID=148309 RepID=A0AAD5WCZ1_PARTN|nr:hypothetical protein KIN20_026688 [Parelaphostrongylus tenuis]